MAQNLYVNLPPNVTILEDADREAHIDGIYEIGSNQIHAHLFELASLDQIRVPLVQLQISQSLAIRAWLSKQPNGQELFFRFHPGTGGITHLFYDMDLVPAPTPISEPIHRSEYSGQIYAVSDILIQLIPGTYFYNIHNLENRTSHYKVSFVRPGPDC